MTFGNKKPENELYIVKELKSYLSPFGFKTHRDRAKELSAFCKKIQQDLQDPAFHFYVILEMVYNELCCFNPDEYGDPVEKGEKNIYKYLKTEPKTKNLDGSYYKMLLKLIKNISGSEVFVNTTVKGVIGKTELAYFEFFERSYRVGGNDRGRNLNKMFCALQCLFNFFLFHNDFLLQRKVNNGYDQNLIDFEILQFVKYNFLAMSKKYPENFRLERTQYENLLKMHRNWKMYADSFIIEELMEPSLIGREVYSFSLGQFLGLLLLFLFKKK